MKKFIFLIILSIGILNQLEASNECFLIEKASNERINHDFQKAIIYLEQSRQKYPNSLYATEVNLKLGKLYFDTQQFKKAKTILAQININQRQKPNEFQFCHNDKLVFFPKKEDIFWDPISRYFMPRLLKLEVKYLTCLLLKEIAIQEKDYPTAIHYLEVLEKIQFINTGCGNAIQDEQAIYQIEAAELYLLEKDTLNSLQKLGEVLQYSSPRRWMFYKILRQKYSREQLQNIAFQEIERVNILYNPNGKYEIKSIPFLNTHIKYEKTSPSLEGLIIQMTHHPLVSFLRIDTAFMLKEYSQHIYFSEDEFHQNEFIELLFQKYSKTTLQSILLQKIDTLDIKQSPNGIYVSPWTIEIFDIKLRIYEEEKSPKAIKNKILAHSFIQKLLK